jgi:hypothetical protein
MAWRVARSLLTLRDQIDGRFPNRSRVSDGYIGDAAHATTDSDHNPWFGPGIVTAADWTHDPRAGFDIDRFTDELAASRDPRIKYIIANGWILDSRPPFSPWQWVRYYGSNPHTSHLHLSVMANSSADDTRRWNIPMLGGGGPAPQPQPGGGKPTPPGGYPFDRNGWHRFGLITGPNELHGGFNASERPYVEFIQRKLIWAGFAHRSNGQQVPPSAWASDGWVDARYERETADAVRRFQARHMSGTTYPGEVWADDWDKLVSL